MSKYFGEAHRALHKQFDTVGMADVLENKLIEPNLGDREAAFISSCDMFFLSTIDPSGMPTVSYKGGAPGFVKVIDDATLAFPSYDGNGMFYSMGNIVGQNKVGLLFIDFTTPRRLRVHGTASVSSDDPLLADYPEANLVVRVTIENAFKNCARYIHKYENHGVSDYVPQAGRETPLPDWKRLNFAQDLLPKRDQGKAEKAGGLISEADYRGHFWRGLD